jgi:hypothetical protein
VLRWKHPVFELDTTGLNPKDLKQQTPSNAKPTITDQQVLACIGTVPQTPAEIKRAVKAATKQGINPVSDAVNIVLARSPQHGIVETRSPRKGTRELITYHRNDLNRSPRDPHDSHF